MASDTKVATVFLGVALLIGWGAFAFGVASVASSQWRTDVTGQILTQARIYVNASFGLWSVCEEADCLSTSSITGKCDVEFICYLMIPSKSLNQNCSKIIIKDSLFL